MHRLSRQIASSTRLLRLSEPSFSSRSPSARRYISKKLWSLPESLSTGSFAIIYKLLKPDLELAETANIGAALLKSAENNSQRERVHLVLKTNYPHLNQDALQKEIARLMAGEEKVVSDEPVPTKQADGVQATSTAPETSKKGAEIASSSTTKSESESTTFQVTDKLDFAKVLESQEAQEALLMFTTEEKDKFQENLVGVVYSEGRPDYESMRKISELLSGHGVKLEIVEAEADPLTDTDYQQQFMTEEQLEIERYKAEAAANPLAQSIEEEQRSPYPNLMSSDPLMDSRDVLDIPPTPKNPYHNRVVVRNHTSMFHEAMALDGFDFNDPRWEPERTDLNEEETTTNEAAGLDSSVNTDKLMAFTLLARFTTQQTGKGKISHFQAFRVLGNGNGMVGLGIGKDEEVGAAYKKAEIAALRNMDYVDRFEDRTIWTDMKSKFRATEIILRPRPTGFGLRCGPIMHQVLKAAGIKDVSGKVWGSRNPVMIMQGLMKMLHGGHAPLGMGDGIGGKGKKMAKGAGMRTQSAVERDRGRKLTSIRK